MDVKVGDKVSVRWDETGARFDATVEAIHADGPSLVFDVCYVEKVQGKRCYEPRVVADRVLPLGSPSPATKRQRGAPPRYADEDDVLVIDSRGGGEENGEGDDAAFDRVMILPHNNCSRPVFLLIPPLLAVVRGAGCGLHAAGGRWGRGCRAGSDQAPRRRPQQQ